MFRTIALRYQVAHRSLKKLPKSNVTRSVCTKDDKTNLRLGSVIVTGLARRKLIHRIFTFSQDKPAICSIQIRNYSSLPSHTKVPLPALSPTMDKGSIVRWEKKEGDKLSEGDLLCEIETDKATMGFETPEEGYLAKILIPAGTKGVPVGKLLCIIVEKQDDCAAFKDFKDDGSHDLTPGGAEEGSIAPSAAAPAAGPAPAAAAPRPGAPPAPRPAAAPAAAGGRVYASPMAKRIADLKNVRLGGTGSGLYGSLKVADVAGGSPAAPGRPAPPLAPPPAPAPGQAYVDIPLSTMREIIAKRLSLSKQTIPHYQLTMCINVDKTLAMRDKVNEKLAKSGQKVSVNDFVIKAVASAAKKVPEINSYWMESFIRQFKAVDVSVAVATPTGLITPIISNADSRGIVDISKDMKALAQKAKDGSLAPNEYQGGTITVSNLGMFGITMFNAIINPPQAAIVACGGIQEMPVIDKKAEGGVRVGKFLYLTVSADHRVTDGVVGAHFMRALKDNLEDPANIIL